MTNELWSLYLHFKNNSRVLIMKAPFKVIQRFLRECHYKKYYGRPVQHISMTSGPQLSMTRVSLGNDTDRIVSIVTAIDENSYAGHLLDLDTEYVIIGTKQLYNIDQKFGLGLGNILDWNDEETKEYINNLSDQPKERWENSYGVLVYNDCLFIIQGLE